VSGDGDSLSIGLGQLSHAIRRNVNLLYCWRTTASTA
jgi:2-oxoglutarate ferredoxin oxidoreductase subunit beta